VQRIPVLRKEAVVLDVLHEEVSISFFGVDKLLENPELYALSLVLLMRPSDVESY
jgi:hypothetical protein